MIVESLYAESVWHRSPMSNGTIRMSMVEGCPRQQAYVIMNYDADYEESGRSQIAADDGNLHEADVVNRLLQAGYRCWNYGEDQAMVYLDKDGVRFRGHPDLFMELQDGEVVGVELKGYRDEIFKAFCIGAHSPERGLYIVTNYDRLTKRPFPLMGQIQMYLHSDTAVEYGIERWVLLMKNKNTADLAEFIVEKDTEYLDKLIRKWKGFWGYTEAGRLPDRFFADDSNECRRCVFREKCWGLPERPTNGKDILDIPELATAASLRRSGVVLKKEGEDMIEESRMQFLTEHIRHETDKIKCDDMFSTVSERTRQGLNSGNVNKLLAEMLENGTINGDQYEDCFSQTNYQEVRFRDRRSS